MKHVLFKNGPFSPDILIFGGKVGYISPTLQKIHLTTFLLVGKCLFASVFAVFLLLVSRGNELVTGCFWTEAFRDLAVCRDFTVPRRNLHETISLMFQLPYSTHRIHGTGIIFPYI